MRRSPLTLALFVAVIALAVVNWRLTQQRHVPSHDPRALSSDTFATIAQRVLPATATIYISGENPRVRELLEQLDPSHPPIDQLQPFIDPDRLGLMDASGSGVIIRDDGYLVTNHHLFADVESPEIEVQLFDGRVYSGDQVELVAMDSLTDLAVLRLSGSGFDAVPFGDSDRANIGDWVLAIGNPLDLSNSVTQGIISAKYRETGQGVIVDFIQSSAHIEPGSSGGALMNIDGELIGINTAIATRTSTWEGFGFALPSNTVRGVVDALIEHGRVPRGFIGIEFQTSLGTLPEGMRRLLGYEGPGGVLVRGVLPNGPASLAGIRRNDILVAVAGQPVADGQELLRTVAALPIESVAEVELWRGDSQTSRGRHLTVDMIISERPTEQELYAQPAPARPPPAPARGFALDEPGLSLESRGVGRRAHVAVRGVTPGSPAQSAGFEVGDVIVRINGLRVRSEESVFGAIRLQTQEIQNHVFLLRRADGTQHHVTLSTDLLGLSHAPEIEPSEEEAVESESAPPHPS